jgi:class 3 adenylate cyclase
MALTRSPIQWTPRPCTASIVCPLLGRQSHCMAEERVQRRLAAILAADVAGYSRLMGADEEGTLERLKAHRRELIDPKIAEHHGRIVKTTGDGMLVAYASVVDAVRCAVEVQQRMTERNADVPGDHRIEFRVGINLGDIIIDGDDIHGDGVNIAARLQAMAEPGAVCLSAGAWEHARGKVSFGADDLGQRQLKNIERPVRVFRIANGASATETKKPLPLPDKPSIAVLPFQNMSADPEQQYFSDGITEDIITELSRFHSLFVIARNSSFSFRGKSLKIQEIAQELGAGYVVEGQCSTGRRSGSYHRTAYRRQHRQPPVGRALRSRHARHLRPAGRGRAIRRINRQWQSGGSGPRPRNALEPSRVEGLRPRPSRQGGSPGSVTKRSVHGTSATSPDKQRMAAFGWEAEACRFAISPALRIHGLRIQRSSKSRLPVG